MKTFSLQEAQAMLPVLEGLLRTSMESKQLIEEVDGDLEELTQRIFVNGGTLVEVPFWARRKAQRDKALQKAKDAVAEINAIGVQVKDLDIGLLDFPCRVGEEVVLLCWKLGEQSITHWHGMEEGFDGRKPIDDRIAAADSDVQ
ncbi:MAG TPA: DUF2203 domain-containing protein [Clostridia bacterium]|nr:DUF2203 domain-containing protein [Clostridia bacterium]